MAKASKPSDDKKDPLLSLTAHEIRNMTGPIMGWVRMLQGDRMGPLTEKQRHVLQETFKTAARLSPLADELSDLSRLAVGSAVFHKGTLDVAALIAQESGLLTLPDHREISVVFHNRAPGATVNADRARLTAAFKSLLIALGRELVSDELSVSLQRVTRDGRPMLQITIAGDGRLDQLEKSQAADLTAFDWHLRGGMGLKLPIAERVVEAHEGQLRSPADGTKSSAIVLLPEA
jgi:signal transduction histidine kinase